MSSSTTRVRDAWSRGWPLGAAALIGGVGLLGLVLEDEVPPRVQLDSPWLYVDIGLGLVGLLLLGYRRRWPIWIMLATGAIGALAVTPSGAAVVAAVSVCARRRGWEMALTGGALIGSSWVFSLLLPEPDLASALAQSVSAAAVIVTAGWLIGRWREDRREAWSIGWRMLVAAGLGLLLWGLATAAGTARGFTPDHPWILLDPLVGLVAVALLPLRRRWPMTVVLLASILSAVSAFAGAASLVVLVSLATRRRWREIVVGVALALISSFVYSFIHPDPRTESLENAITNVVIIAFAIALGLFIGARRELVSNLREQVATAKREQQARVEQARTQERTRIAREMHDVLAHRISLVAMHAGALAYREDLPPEQVRSTAALLQSSSHQALIELREVLGVLRDTDGTDGGPEPPQPTLDDVAGLVESARQGGQVIELDHSLDLTRLPNSLSRNSFRIVQESLTNARKHAPDQVARVSLAGSAGEELRLQVSNARSADSPGPSTPGAGLGLVGLRERAHLSGGTLEAGPNRAGDFVVRATLPWPLGDTAKDES